MFALEMDTRSSRIIDLPPGQWRQVKESKPPARVGGFAIFKMLATLAALFLTLQAAALDGQGRLQIAQVVMGAALAVIYTDAAVALIRPLIDQLNFSGGIG